jgi:hypothetical protein
MATTYDKIATTTLGTAATSITFSSITGSYTDLRIVFIIPTMTGTTGARIQFNGDTASNYSYTALGGDGATAQSLRGTSQTEYKIGGAFVNPSATVPYFYEIDIFSYAGSTNKTALASFNNDQNGAGSIEKTVGLWRSTSAITSLVLKSNGTVTFGIGTTATLYGILKA